MSYIQNTPDDVKAMLSTIGVGDIEDLFKDIPEEVRRKNLLALPEALSEMELWNHMSRLAEQNHSTQDFSSFLGAGAYNHFTPSLVDALQSRGEFLTAYTPYQAEASQGTLQHIFEFQTMICELTGMEAANASHYDAATALAEAAGMAIQATGRNVLAVSGTLHPHYREVLRTQFQHRDIRILEIAHANGKTPIDMIREVAKNAAAVLVQNPNFFGTLEEMTQIAEEAHAEGALAIAAVNPISLGLLQSPGECGFDIVVGDAQPLGIPLSFGGPWAGFLASRKERLRQIPGRLVGETLDSAGNPGFVLTLQTREQHIRREKATSNICTNQALMALRATIYMTAMGPNGLKNVASLCVQRAHDLSTKVPGRIVYPSPFFHEFVVEFSKPISKINEQLLERGIQGGYDLVQSYGDHRNMMLICCTEQNSPEEIDQFASALKEISG